MTFIYTSKADFNTSSAIATIAHNSHTDALYVRFTNDNEVVYEDVAESTFNLFASADSLGGFYNRHISGQFTAIAHGYGGDTELVSYYDTAESTGHGTKVPDVAASISTGPWPHIGDPQPPLTPWTFDTETTISIPEPPVSRYRVHWEDEDGTTGSSAIFEATSEQGAIELFNESVAAASRLGLRLAVTDNGVKVTAVTHYID